MLAAALGETAQHFPTFSAVPRLFVFVLHSYFTRASQVFPRTSLGVRSLWLSSGFSFNFSTVPRRFKARRFVTASLLLHCFDRFTTALFCCPLSFYRENVRKIQAFLCVLCSLFPVQPFSDCLSFFLGLIASVCAHKLV